MEEKRCTTWQIVNLELKIQIEPVKAVSYSIITAHCSVHLTQSTQRKYRDLLTNNRTDVEHFSKNLIELL